MTLCDYFSAADDPTAVAVIQVVGGPSRAAHDVVFLKNIDPVVAMAQLEAVMTGCSYAEACRRPRAGELLSPPEGEGPFVFSLSDTLAEALVAATQSDLVRSAGSWSGTPELRQARVDADMAAGVLEALAGLARRARADGLRLYCWWAL